MAPVRIAVVGAGPAGLFFAACVGRKVPHCRVTVFERRSDQTPSGWGVVLAARALQEVAVDVPELAAAVREEGTYWDRLDIHHRERTSTAQVQGYYSIARQRLVNLLTEDVRRFGVDLQFGVDIQPDSDLLDPYDLIVAADGVNSRFRSPLVRERHGLETDLSTNRYSWLGTYKSFDAFQFIFQETVAGWIWAHVYPDRRGMTTFIVECEDLTWRNLGLGDMSEQATVEFLQRLFEEALGGHALASSLPNSYWPGWKRFRRVPLGPLFGHRTYLIGDAGCTLHFSVGSGIRKAFGDGSALAATIARHGVTQAALQACERDRLS
ncbi:MAG TPA: NAD(P)-binding protein, partial [Gemmatimonadales bacterium]|nr:NAD(P)-binding protein [Gemmatimonadales bacterium]